MGKHIYNNHVEYNCTKCGKYIVGKIQYKSLSGEPVCRNCQTFERKGVVNNFQLKEVREKVINTVRERYGVDNVHQLESVKEKAKKTNLERYGVENPSQNKEIKSKTRKTNLERYGVENVFSSEIVKTKIKSTNLERRGVEYPMQSENVKDTLKANNLEKYGVEYTLQVPEIKNKIKNTVINKYGVENILQSKEVRERIKQTNLEKYGVTTILSAPEIKNKIKETNLRKYGTENVFASEEIKEKIIITNLEKYGVKNVGQSLEVQEKIKQTNLKKYGAENPFKSKEIWDKIKAKNLLKYGVEYPSQSQENLEKNKIKRNSEEHINFKINKAEEDGYTYISKFVEDGETTLRFKCPKCNNEFDWRLRDDSRNVFCKECAKSSGSSMKEILLRDYIRELLNDNTIAKDRTLLGKRRELDIYIPSKNLAIEFDGIYYHNDKDNSYKFEECQKRGIRLIQINEYEWDTKNSLIKSYIKSSLGIYDKRIYARECEIKKIDNDIYKNFVEENHLQGYVPASIRYGLYYKDELVQIISLGKSRYAKYQYELLRECSKSGYSIIGGKERLFKHFLRDYNPENIVSYCERNKFSGESYIRCGFRLDHISKKGYRYYKNNTSISREQAQKHKLKKLLENYDDSLTEKENMINNGYNLIYDYGNYVFVFDNK